MRQLRVFILISFVCNAVIANAQDYEVPAPSFNMADTNACKNELCTGKWVFDNTYIEDSAVTGRVINNGGELGITLIHNNSTTNRNPWAVVFRESEWVFYKNNTYKILGQYTKFKAAENGVDIIILERKDTVIYGTWNLRFDGYHSSYDDTAHYFTGNGYNVRIHHITINRMKNAYEVGGIDIVGNLQIVQGGVKMPHWEGQLSTFSDRMAIIPDLFIYDDGSHILWLHK